MDRCRYSDVDGVEIHIVGPTLSLRISQSSLGRRKLDQSAYRYGNVRE